VTAQNRTPNQPWWLVIAISFISVAVIVAERKDKLLTGIETIFECSMQGMYSVLFGMGTIIGVIAEIVVITTAVS